MPDPHIKAAFYLSPTADAVWRWSDDGKTLVWPDNTTIAFWPEVEAVLKHLAPRGLPAFGAVALLLGACRDGWLASPGRRSIVEFAEASARKEIESARPGRLVGAGLVQGRVAQELAALCKGLDAVHALPRGQREGRVAKALLAEVVFESCPNRSSAEDARFIAAALDDGINIETLRPNLGHEASLSQFARQVDGLSDGLARVDSQRLVNRRETGLDETVEAADEDLSPPERVRRLLAALRDDPELGGLARVTQSLMAAVGVPRTLRSRDELALGGVSDISNRGPLDRLLVSELAHDDLTLAVRVAANEALYVRREPPQGEPPRRRAILLDSGIRMWGVPRVFASAVALAMAATNDPRGILAVFRASAARVVPVDLTRREGLDAHLAALETLPHPAAAIEPFFRAIDAKDHYDAIVVTHPDVLADPKFVASIHVFHEQPIYVATVDRDGAFRLVVLSKAGKKIVREAKLSLDALLAPGVGPEVPRRPSNPLPLLAQSIDPALPAILFSDRFPLYLPYVADPAHAAASERHGLVAATDDGRLLQWRDGGHGSRQLTSLLPRGAIRLVAIDDAAGTASVVVTRKHQAVATLVIADLETGRPAVIRLDLPWPNPSAVFDHAGILYLIKENRVEAFTAHEGRPIGSLTVPAGFGWMRSRFFSGAGKHWALAWDGSPALKLEHVPAAPLGALLFDREGFDGPWSLTRDHRILDDTGKEYRKFNPPFPRWQPLGISADGHRLVFQMNEGTCVVMLEDRLDHRRVIQQNVAEELLAPQIHWSTRSPVTPRNKFAAVFADSQSRVSLATKQGDVFSLALNEAGVLALMEVGRTPVIPSNAEAFAGTRRSEGMRFKMHVATWKDGSKAWLDGRGMLHLKSSDRSVHELSIVLSNRRPAGWSSEGKVCGPEYFIGDAPPTSGEYFSNLLRQFVARLR
ncbi:MAG TPA: hypothetical protein VG269_24710 [Tepidisphaeraceae bacterium]|jgi:hypothetical protein|nr:hypothetical protein [Tepidisphaeraceae bacterium]